MVVVLAEVVADEGEAADSLGQVAEDEEHKVIGCMCKIIVAVAVEAGSAEVGWWWAEV